MAQVDYYLKIDGIDGEVTHDFAKGTIEVLSWSWGETNQGSSGTGGGAGKVSMQDLHFTVRMDTTFPDLALACASGRHIQKMEIHGIDSRSSQPFTSMVWKMQDCLVSSVGDGGSEGNQSALVSFSMNFTKISWTSRSQSADGSVKSKTWGWDVKANTKV